MAVREVPKNEHTKDGRKWIYEIRFEGKRYKSKKFLTKKEALAAERLFYEEKEKIGNQTMMTLGDLFDDHYNYQKDKVKMTTLSNYGKKIKHFNSIKNIKSPAAVLYSLRRAFLSVILLHPSRPSAQDLLFPVYCCRFLLHFRKPRPDKYRIHALRV